MSRTPQKWVQAEVAAACLVAEAVEDGEGVGEVVGLIDLTERNNYSGRQRQMTSKVQMRRRRAVIKTRGIQAARRLKMTTKLAVSMMKMNQATQMKATGSQLNPVAILKRTTRTTAVDLKGIDIFPEDHQ